MPNVFRSLSSGTSMPNLVAQINSNFAKLDQEAVVKQFGRGDTQVIIGKNGKYIGMVVGDIEKNAVIYGMYRDDRFGTLYIQNGVPNELQGQAPNDGRMGHWITKPGINVLTALGG